MLAKPCREVLSSCCMFCAPDAGVHSRASVSFALVLLCRLFADEIEEKRLRRGVRHASMADVDISQLLRQGLVTGSVGGNEEGSPMDVDSDKDVQSPSTRPTDAADVVLHIDVNAGMESSKPPSSPAISDQGSDDRPSSESGSPASPLPPTPISHIGGGGSVEDVQQKRVEQANAQVKRCVFLTANFSLSLSLSLSLFLCFDNTMDASLSVSLPVTLF